MKTFPWQLFWRYTGIQFAVLMGVSIFAFFLFRLQISNWGPAIHEPHFVEHVRVLLLIFLLAFSALVFSTLFLLWRILTPLGNLRGLLLEPLQGIRTQEEAAVQEESAEWSEVMLSVEKVIQEVLVLREKTKTDQSEVQTLLGALINPVIAVDLQGRPLIFNTAFESLFSEPIKERRLKELFRSPDVIKPFEKVLKQGEVAQVEVGLYLKKEKYPRYFLITASPLRRSHTQELYGAMGIFREITEQKRTDQMRIDFVANVSHELRTPLTSLRGYAETVKMDLEKGHVDENTLKFLGVVLSNSDRMINLVSDLLDLSSLEAGAPLNLIEMGTEEVSREVIGRLPETHPMKLDIRSPKIKADPTRIDQILTNVLINATKYTPEGSPIDVVWEPGENNTTVLRVIDSGPGISPEHLPRLFERFYRVDAARSRDVGGTGLGLSIVKHIMMRHGGEVEVRSLLGKGTEIRCVFPKEL